MLEFIVMGQIPGTNIQVDFAMLLMGALIVLGSASIVAVALRLWHKSADNTHVTKQLSL